MPPTRGALAALGALAVLGSCAVSVVLAACSPAPTGPAVGTSLGRGAGSSSARAPDAGGANGPTPLPDFRASFAKLTPERVTSRGHAGGRFDVEIYASPSAKAAFTSTGDYPVGAIFVMEHFEGGSRGPVMMIEKREKGYAPSHGDWRYVTVASSGEVKKDGIIEACATCHDDAARDSVFPLPKVEAK